MKIDMHCHVREGSVDSRVSLDEYITTLKEKGFDGMLITDHDTYQGEAMHTDRTASGQAIRFFRKELPVRQN